MAAWVKSRPEQKIGAAVATIMALARCVAVAEDGIYGDGRGLLGLS